VLLTPRADACEAESPAPDGVPITGADHLMPVPTGEKFGKSVARPM
jgi:hypothetical protein